MTLRTFNVPGISCGHCKVAIEDELAGVAGVATATVDVEARTVTVDGDAPDSDVVAAITEAGYEVAGNQ